jgi:AcrR family transcriptional regulator
VTVAPPFKAEDRREQILNAAMRLFLDHGVQNVTTRDIAAAVGISQPSLYAHFKSREDIAVKLSERAFEQLSARMAAAANAAGTPHDRLKCMGQVYVAFGLEQSAAYRIAFMLERTTAQPSEQQAIHESGMRCFAILHDLFKSVRNSDDLKTAALAQSAWASMHGLVALLLSRPEFPWIEQEVLIASHLEQVCRRAFD